MSAPEPLPTCQEVVEIISDYLEGMMAPPERERCEMHLTVCAACRIYLEQLRETISLTGRLSEESVPDDTREALMAAFRDWKR